MLATLDFDRELGRFTIDPQAELSDHTEKFAGGQVFFDVPAQVEGSHPDLLALVTILVLHPFVGERLYIDVAVSEGFKAACTAFLPYTCEFAPTPADVHIDQRPRGAVPGLSFSGGIDSTAALAVMPATTKAFFLDRTTSDGSPLGGLYVKESAEVACRMIADLGYEVHMVQTNLEYVRNPVGFPLDWSSGAPAVLMADHCGLSSVSWGMVAESGYKVGHAAFLDFAGRTIYTRWNGMLSAVGLSLGVPVAGVSEVGTSLIEQRSALAGVGQSCIRGKKGKPCEKCAKCFRKLLLDTALNGERFPAERFDSMSRFPGGDKILLGRPMKHEDVYRWTAERLQLEGDSPTWDAFTARLDVGALDVSWADAWYPPAAALIPEEFRQNAVEAIRKYLPSHTPAQQHAFEEWDMKDALAAPEMTDAIRVLEDQLKQSSTQGALPARAEQAESAPTTGTLRSTDRTAQPVVVMVARVTKRVARHFPRARRTVRRLRHFRRRVSAGA